jgi:hypothetical protein
MPSRSVTSMTSSRSARGPTRRAADQRRACRHLQRGRQRRVTGDLQDELVDLHRSLEAPQDPLAHEPERMRRAPAQAHRRVGDQHRPACRLGTQTAGLNGRCTEPVLALAHHVTRADPKAQGQLVAADRQPASHPCSPAAASRPATALPKVAITPSPTPFTTLPPIESTTCRLARSNSTVRTSATSSPTLARYAVEPTTSVNSTVTVSGRAAMRNSTARARSESRSPLPRHRWHHQAHGRRHDAPTTRFATDHHATFRLRAAATSMSRSRSVTL